jgi:hypothetical protein
VSAARSLLAALALVTMTSTASAQVRHRRPMGPSPTVNYHFDNNSAGGCRDYNCGGRCYDGHSGTDSRHRARATSVLAGADGTVIATNNGCANTGYVGNPCGGRCGNYVQLQHSDGSRHDLLPHAAQLPRGLARAARALRADAGALGELGQLIGAAPALRLASLGQRGFTGLVPGALHERAGRVGRSERVPAEPRRRRAQCIPSPETCDGRDDDCDGRVDDGLSRSCYSGPDGHLGARRLPRGDADVRGRPLGRVRRRGHSARRELQPHGRRLRRNASTT